MKIDWLLIIHTIIFIMSLFKLKSLWSKNFPEEEFDQKHLAIGKLGRQPSVAVGNFVGNLRVYLMNKSRELEVQCIYDNKFESGIIDVKFVLHPDDRLKNNTLGVLFFRKFAFIHFTKSDSAFEVKISYVDVEPSFGISVSPTAVMTLNSTVQFLNPLEILKIKSSDPIYPYARSFNKLYFADGQELVEIEGQTEQWRIIVGRMKQIFVFVDTLVIIGEKNLWQISHAKIIKTKVLEEDISCGCLVFKGVNAYNIIIANFSHQMFIYSQNYQLLWAVKLDYIAIKIIVCDHEEVKGMLAILSENGTLELGYSGVQTAEAIIEPIADNANIDVAGETQKFMRMLKQNKESNSKSKGKVMEKEKICFQISISEPQKSYENHEMKERLFKLEDKILKATLLCQITSKQPLQDVVVQINLPSNLYSAQTIKQLRVGKNKDKIVFTIYASNESFAYDSAIWVFVRYSSENSKSQIFKQKITIPMGLQCFISSWESNESYSNKIIIKSNSELPSFNQIFAELIPKQTREQRKSIEFTLSNGVKCLITYNKGFNKAKVESEYYSGLCFIIGSFSDHIRKFNQKQSAKIQLSVQIPLEEFFTIMKEHYDHRLLLKLAFKDVQTKSEQFRNTQKKLLLKMKEKMSSVGSIDKLLEYNYDRLMESTSKYQQCLSQMQVINHNLCVAIKLIIQLLFIRANPSQKAKSIALGILGYQKESMERGWQDKLMSNCSYYLNRKYNKNESITFEQLQKIPLYVISKVNNGDWN